MTTAAKLLNLSEAMVKQLREAAPSRNGHVYTYVIKGQTREALKRRGGYQVKDWMSHCLCFDLRLCLAADEAVKAYMETDEGQKDVAHILGQVDGQGFFWTGYAPLYDAIAWALVRSGVLKAEAKQVAAWGVWFDGYEFTRV